MANWKKIGWYTGIGTASLTGLFFLARGVFNKASSLEELKKLSDELQSIPSAKIHSLNAQGLTIRIDVKLKNPTRNGFKMTYPFLNVLYGKKPMGSSQAVNKVLSIPPNGEVNIEAIMLTFPLMSLLSLAGTLVKSLNSGEAVKLNVKMTATVDPLWQVTEQGDWKKLKDFGIKKLRFIPYESDQPVTIRKGT
jgi:hypothetical protein